MNDLADVDGFKIRIQVFVWLGFPPLEFKNPKTKIVLDIFTREIIEYFVM